MEERAERAARKIKQPHVDRRTDVCKTAEAKNLTMSGPKKPR